MIIYIVTAVVVLGGAFLAGMIAIARGCETLNERIAKRD